MESQDNKIILQIYNDIQRMAYACKYGDWYYENKDYFEQNLNLRKGKLSVDEYADEFDRL